MTLKFSKEFNPLSNYVTGSKGGVDDFLVEMWQTWRPLNQKA